MNKSAEQHLAKAKDYVARGEEFYRKAAVEIVAAQKADHTLSKREIGEWFGRGEDWVNEHYARQAQDSARRQREREVERKGGETELAPGSE